MNKFWKIYSWIYLCTILLAIGYYALNPFEYVDPEVTKQTSYIIAYSMISLLWLIPVVGLFLYAFRKRKIIVFWRLYFVYMTYNIITQLLEIFKTKEVPPLLPFHIIALVGLFLYSFTKNSGRTIPNPK